MTATAWGAPVPADHPVRAATQTTIVALAAAAVSGLLVGGVLGRLAMRLLALTSPDIAQGRLTDDAARVGAFSLSGSVTLAIALTVFSALLVGPAYLLARRILPSRRRDRIACFALLTGLVGGALFVHDHPSFDYTILQPTWLAVSLFVAVPAGVGALTAFLTELVVPPPRPQFPGPLGRWWRSRAVTVAGWTLYAVLIAWGAYNIGADIASLAGDAASGLPLTV